MSGSYTIPLYRVQLVRDGPQVEDRPQAKAPEDTARLLLPLLEDDGREHFGVILLDTRHRITGVVEVSVGCLTSSLVHPREVFAAAIGGKAAAIVLYHNHPSGDPEPSAEDIALTRRLMTGGGLLGVEVLDHIIIGNGTGRWVSLKDRGVL